MDRYQEDTYGQRIAGVYDDWYDILDEATVPVLRELAQGGAPSNWASAPGAWRSHCSRRASP